MTIPIEPGYYWYKQDRICKWEIKRVKYWASSKNLAATTSYSAYSDICDLKGEWGTKIESPDTDGVLIETKEEYDTLPFCVVDVERGQMIVQFVGTGADEKCIEVRVYIKSRRQWESELRPHLNDVVSKLWPSQIIKKEGEYDKRTKSMD